MPTRAYRIRWRRNPAVAPFRCEICLEDVPRGDRYGLSCGHGFCRVCMAQFLESKVNDDAIRICCPSAGCHHVLQMEEVVNGLTQQELRSRYRSSVAQANRPSQEADAAMERLLTSNIVRRCPRCKHGIEKSDGCDHMRCRCGASFCWQCGADYDGPTGIRQAGNAAHARGCRHWRP